MVITRTIGQLGTEDQEAAAAATAAGSAAALQDTLGDPVALWLKEYNVMDPNGKIILGQEVARLS
jgi:hypothetical protein